MDGPVAPLADVPRHHALAEQPVAGKVWSYAPRDLEPLRAEVLRVSQGGSFIERMLRMITRSGESKHFEELTGQDGLTFGITDFAGSGVRGFFDHFAEHFPLAFASAFGPHQEDLLDEDWIKQNNAGGNAEANNAGLIRHRWLREGLAALLAERRFHGFQLAHFVRGKVAPCLRLFTERGFRLEPSLAALVGIANSYGPAGLRAHFLVPLAGRAEDQAVRDMLRAYVARERAKYPHTERLLRVGFGEEAGAPPGDGQLGHRGRRARAIFSLFPLAGQTPFAALGRFSLDADEVFPPEPTTAT